MADKPKKQKAKAKKDQPGVLGSLSTARPERIGSRRGTAAAAPAVAAETAPAAATTRAEPAATAAAKRAAKPTATAEAGAAKTATKPKTAAPPPAAKTKTPAKPKTAATPPPAAKTASRPKRAAKPKAAAPHTFEPTPAAEAAAQERPAASRPRPVRDAAPGIGGRREPHAEAQDGDRTGGPELAATAVKAAGEVAQLGLTIGGKLLKRAAERLPKP